MSRCLGAARSIREELQGVASGEAETEAEELAVLRRAIRRAGAEVGGATSEMLRAAFQVGKGCARKARVMWGVVKKE